MNSAIWYGDGVLRDADGNSEVTSYVLGLVAVYGNIDTGSAQLVDLNEFVLEGIFVVLAIQ